MNESEFSKFDAFAALNDLDQSENLYKFRHTSRNRRRLKESSLSINDKQDLDKAEKIRNEAMTEKEPEIEIIDANADNLDHILNKQNYVGQVICKCNKCKSLRFVDIDKLEQDANNDNVYTIEQNNECPNCHSDNVEYTLIGQVGEVKQEEPTTEIENDQTSDNSEEVTSEEIPETEDSEDVKIENDEKVSEEPTFENDQPIEEPAEEIPEETNQTSEEESEESYEEPEEQAYDETDLKDDTNEIEVPKAGDEYDIDDVPEDDTSPFETDEEEEKEETNESIEEETETELPEETEENTEEEELPEITTISNLLDQIVDEDKLQDIHVIDNGEEVFKGSYEELQNRFKQLPIVAFSTGKDLDDQTSLILNVSAERESNSYKVEDILNLLKDHKHNKIILTMNNDEENSQELDFDQVQEEASDYKLISMEVPQTIYFYVGEESEEQEEEKSDEDELIESILKQNNLSKNNVNKPGCNEYWIREAIQSGEDLDVIYKGFVKNCNEDTINKFKDYTRFQDEVDEAYFNNLSETAARNDNKDEAIEKATKLLKENKAFAVVYGYSQAGKFFAINPMLVARDEKEYDLIADLVRNKYHVSGIIYTLYARNVGMDLNEEIEELRENFTVEVDGKSEDIKNFAEKLAKELTNEEGGVFAENGQILITCMSAENEQKIVDTTKRILEECKLQPEVFEVKKDENNIPLMIQIDKIKVTKEQIIGESVKSFKTRRALTEQIIKCRENNKKVKVRKSMRRGYKYDLVEQAKKPYGLLVYELNEIMLGMNNEDAYMAWIQYYPDGMSSKEAVQEWTTHEEFKEMEEFFEDIYKAYHRDGLANVTPRVLTLAHQYDKKLGLRLIQDVADETKHQSKAEDELEDKIIEILTRAGIDEDDYDIEEESDASAPKDYYKVIYSRKDDIAKKAYNALKGKFETVQIYREPWESDYYSDVEVLVKDSRVNESFNNTDKDVPVYVPKSNNKDLKTAAIQDEGSWEYEFNWNPDMNVKGIVAETNVIKGVIFTVKVLSRLSLEETREELLSKGIPADNLNLNWYERTKSRNGIKYNDDEFKTYLFTFKVNTSFRNRK